MSKLFSKDGENPAGMLFKSAFVTNPILTQAIGICPVVAVAYSVKGAVMLSAALAVVMLMCEYLAAFIINHLPRWLRIACYLVFSTAVLCGVIPVLDGISPEGSAALGVYLPLLSVNSLVVIRCEKFAVKSTVSMNGLQKLLYCLLDTISSGMGYAVVIIVTAFVRQQLFEGKILGIGAGVLPSFPVMAMPFGGLVVLCFTAAAHKMLVKRLFPDEQTDVFDFSTALKMPLIYDPGIRAAEENGSLINEPYTLNDKLRKKGIETQKKEEKRQYVAAAFQDPFSEYVPAETEYAIRPGLDFTDDDVEFIAIPVEEEDDSSYGE